MRGTATIVGPRLSGGTRKKGAPNSRALARSEPPQKVENTQRRLQRGLVEEAGPADAVHHPKHPPERASAHDGRRERPAVGARLRRRALVPKAGHKRDG